jgi:AraC-like DNA-binding protein
MAAYWTYEGVEFLHGSYRETFAAHAHDEYSVSVIVSGAMRFLWSRRTHIAVSDTVAVINPGELHTGEPANDAGWETRNLLISGSVLEKFIQPERCLDLAGPVICDPHTARALVLAHKATQRDAKPCLASDVALARAFGRLFSRHCADRVERRRHTSTARAQDYLRENFSKTVRLKTLAELTGITHFHLIRTFARDTGFTPHAYQGQLRIAHALGELKRGRSPAQAAASSGFHDQSHMSRAITRSQGLTPGAIARAW